MSTRKSPRWTVGKRLRAGLQRLIQTRIWGMDIHPSAMIEPTALIDRTWPRGIHIGPETLVGEEAVVLAHDMTRGVYMDTRIGARCVLGPRSIILPGVTIGDDCLVMPGAMVTKSMPPGSLAVGNPAEIKDRPDEG